MKLSFICSKEKLKRQFNIQHRQDLRNRYHIAPLDSTYVLTNTSTELQLFRWGLIPASAKDVSAGDNLSLAMAENASHSPSFRMPIRQRRCLVFADSYYTHKTQGRLSQPFRVHYSDNSLLTLAGIWDLWQDAQGQLYKTFSILTVSSAETPHWALNPRMPLILDKADLQAAWLSELSLPEIQALMRPCTNPLLTWYPVSKQLEESGYESESLHQPIAWTGF